MPPPGRAPGRCCRCPLRAGDGSGGLGGQRGRAPSLRRARATGPIGPAGRPPAPARPPPRPCRRCRPGPPGARPPASRPPARPPRLPRRPAAHRSDPSRCRPEVRPGPRRAGAPGRGRVLEGRAGGEPNGGRGSGSGGGGRPGREGRGASRDASRVPPRAPGRHRRCLSGHFPVLVSAVQHAMQNELTFRARAGRGVFAPNTTARGRCRHGAMSGARVVTVAAFLPLSSQKLLCVSMGVRAYVPEDRFGTAPASARFPTLRRLTAPWHRSLPSISAYSYENPGGSLHLHRGGPEGHRGRGPQGLQRARRVSAGPGGWPAPPPPEGEAAQSWGRRTGQAAGEWGGLDQQRGRANFGDRSALRRFPRAAGA
jgi:hypothetical protein